eukprot:snap_masked-scaffold_4-processed-gene-0.14-mRNA-1 protein AED:1.00 eAED:1.00 QI:0/0/0/0/1/1/2/0/272
MKLIPDITRKDNVIIVKQIWLQKFRLRAIGQTIFRGNQKKEIDTLDIRRLQLPIPVKTQQKFLNFLDKCRIKTFRVFLLIGEEEDVENFLKTFLEKFYFLEEFEYVGYKKHQMSLILNLYSHFNGLKVLKIHGDFIETYLEEVESSSKSNCLNTRTLQVEKEKSLLNKLKNITAFTFPMTMLSHTFYKQLNMKYVDFKLTSIGIQLENTVSKEKVAILYKLFELCQNKSIQKIFINLCTDLDLDKNVKRKFGTLFLVFPLRRITTFSTFSDH